MKRLPQVLAPLAKLKHFVIWRWEERDDGKRSKVPYQSLRPNRHANVNDRDTWSSVEDALAATRRDGIGLMLRGAQVGALDLDDCVNKGRIDDWAQYLIDKAKAYVETTPSGHGVRILGLAYGEPVHTARPMGKKGRLEIYRDCARYITITGNQIGDCQSFPCIDKVIDKFKAAESRTKRVFRNSRSDWRDVIKRYNPSIIGMVKAEYFNGVDRSRLICSIACKLFERGASVEEVAAVIEESTAFKAKFGGRERTAWDEAVKLHEWWEGQR